MLDFVPLFLLFLSQFFMVLRPILDTLHEGHAYPHKPKTEGLVKAKEKYLPISNF